MIGRDAETLAESYEGGVMLPPPSTAPPVLEVEGLSGGELFRRLVRRATRRDPGHLRQPRRWDDRGGARVLFGRERPTSGTMRLDGKPIAPKTTREAKQLGIAYLSENRRATIFPRHEIFKNITLAHLDEIVGGVIRQSRESDHRGDLVQRTGVRPPDPSLAAGNLSGGNQQKVVLAKWLTVQPKVLILNEPTRGMDVGAKREVLDLIKALKAEGWRSSSSRPSRRRCWPNRTVSWSCPKGQIAKEFAGERVSKDLLMSYA